MFSLPLPALHIASHGRCRQAQLWAFAAWALAKLVDWFGSAEQIARQPRVNARWVWDFTSPITRLEALVRRLVIAEAKALRRAPAKAGTSRMGARVARAPLPAWRGRLCISLWPRGGRPPAHLPPTRRGRRATEAPSLLEPDTIDVLPWARRLDAVARAVANPLVPARRLAARMRRTNAPMRKIPRPVVVLRTERRDEWRQALRAAQDAAEPPRRESG